MNKSTIEQVLVIERIKLFHGQVIPQGFSKDNLTAVLQGIRAYAYFIDRPKAENDSSLKQIIPYMLITCWDNIFLLQRYTSQTESRLHNKYSIGVGGHINPIKKSLNVPRDIIEKALERELNEELSVKDTGKPQLIGYLNDDSNSVGSVHFGMIYQLEVKDKKLVTVSEKDLMAGRFITSHRLGDYYDRMETWSQILTKELFRNQ